MSNQKTCHHCHSSITCWLFKLNASQKVKLGQKFMVFDPQDRDPLPKDTYLSALAQERLLNFSLLWKLNSVQDLEGITAFQGYWLQMQNFLAWYLSYSNPSAILRFPEAKSKLMWQECQLPCSRALEYGIRYLSGSVLKQPQNTWKETFAKSVYKQRKKTPEFSTMTENILPFKISFILVLTYMFLVEISPCKTWAL